MFTAISDDLARDPWFKIVEFLQQNWAVVVERNGSVLVVFYGDTCGVFDELEYTSRVEAEAALTRNGFAKYLEAKDAKGFIALPRGDFQERAHPNGRIYSSGRFWN